jgi:hypothetical protein
LTVNDAGKPLAFDMFDHIMETVFAQGHPEYPPDKDGQVVLTDEEVERYRTTGIVKREYPGRVVFYINPDMEDDE